MREWAEDRGGGAVRKGAALGGATVLARAGGLAGATDQGALTHSRGQAKLVSSHSSCDFIEVICCNLPGNDRWRIAIPEFSSSSAVSKSFPAAAHNTGDRKFGVGN